MYVQVADKVMRFRYIVDSRVFPCFLLRSSFARFRCGNRMRLNSTMQFDNRLRWQNLFRTLETCFLALFIDWNRDIVRRHLSSGSFVSRFFLSHALFRHCSNEFKSFPLFFSSSILQDVFNFRSNGKWSISTENNKKNEVKSIAIVFVRVCVCVLFVYEGKIKWRKLWV